VRLVILGSGDAFHSGGRGHACAWLEGIAKGPLLVDAGATALASMRRLGLDPSALRGVLLTHLHGDHVAGLPFLWIDACFNTPRQAPLAILGPRGTARVVDGLVRLAYGDVADEPPEPGVEIEEIAAGERRDWLGVRVDTWRADHMDPPAEALGLRVTGRGRSLAFTGDSAISEELVAGARGADVVVADCTALAPPAGRHGTWQEWKPRLADLEAGRVVLTHLDADVRAAAPRVVAEAPPAVNVRFAEDGDVFDLEGL
jgi:ribonuclease BN (tRNA processing enzyme)